MNTATKQYSEGIQTIHNDFFGASEKLLKDAKNILNNPPKHDLKKAETLKQLGFVKSKDIASIEGGKDLLKLSEKQIEAINYFKRKYPNNKFITHEMAKSICKKYNLVLGDVSLFKGFVPEKNMNDVVNFFIKNPTLKTQYIKHSAGIFGIEKIITEDEYNKGLEIENSKKAAIEIKEIKKPLQSTRSLQDELIYGWNAYHLATISFNMGGMFDERYVKKDIKLNICAPLKEMDMTGKKLKAHIVVEKDPIVMCPIKHENGIEGFLIVTAWGDESSDELVINHNQN